MQRKLLGLLFAAAAYGIYKYTKMTPEQKENLKKKGGDMLKDLSGMRSTAGNKMAAVSTENNY